MTVTDQIKRFEYKYSISKEIVDTIQKQIDPFVDIDSYCCRNGNDGIYTVRSIYFDTEDFLFYHQKIDGLKNRKKLRIRAYDNQYDSAQVFLEIKRKYNNSIAKERTKIPLVKVDDTLNGGSPDLLSPDSSPLEKKALDRFVYNHKRLKLIPVLLVVYRRMAFIGKDDPRARLTIDTQISCFPYPSTNQLYIEDKLKLITNFDNVLEIKFNNWMTGWQKSLVKQLNLFAEPISKYCLGLQTWDMTGIRQYRS